MAVLDSSRSFRARPATLGLVAIVVLALAATVAAVQPTSPMTVGDQRDVASIVRDIRSAEKRWKPQLESIENIEIEYEPAIQQLEAIETGLDEEALAEIERQMEPFETELEALALEMEPLQGQLEQLQEEMEPFHEEIEALHQDLRLDEITLGDLDIRDDMTIEELMEQVHEAYAPLQEQIEAAHARIAPQLAAIEKVHFDMAPYHERIEEIQREMEPLIERITEAHLQELQPQLEAIEKAQLDLEPMHERLAELEKRLEPFHDEMKRLGDELETAVGRDIEALLRRTLGTVVGADAPFDEAAARIADEASIQIDDHLLQVRASQREIRTILSDVFGPERSTGLSDLSFDSAVDDAVEAISHYEVEIPE